jgi:hypothetical protein
VVYLCSTYEILARREIAISGQSVPIFI